MDGILRTIALQIRRGWIEEMESIGDTYELINKTRGNGIASRIRRARGIWARTIGLMGRRSLDPDEGLWIVPCNGIHTIGMRFSIDVVVLDCNMRVLKIVDGLRPFHVVVGVRGGHSVLELSAGRASTVSVGDELDLTTSSARTSE